MSKAAAEEKPAVAQQPNVCADTHTYYMSLPNQRERDWFDGAGLGYTRMPGDLLIRQRRLCADRILAPDEYRSPWWFCR
jgi:hypothetical protein